MNETMMELKNELKKGKISAALKLAEGFKWGYFGACDPRRAAKMYRICTKSLNKETAALGFYNLGVLYYHGYLTKEEEEEKRQKMAYSCFMKSALLHHTPQALCSLGDMYRYGKYVEKDEGVALKLYRRASVCA